jgi:predicted O-methyltransferase YrrM
MDKLIEKYILEHSSPEDPILEELYRETHLRFINPNMSTGYIQGMLLQLISKMVTPENILEIGTFTGYSAICLARGLKPGGRLVTIEINDELKEFSSAWFIKAGVETVITQLTGRAQEIIPELDQIFDLVYIDGDKREYADYYNLSIDKVRSGGFIIADNVLWGGKVLEVSSRDQQTRGIIEFNEMIAREKGVEKIILPLRDGLMIIRKK